MVCTVLRPRVTLRDVARSAGVSVSTASRALTDSQLISRTTSQRVRDAASRLGYHFDPIGRALRSNSSASIGLVVPNINNPFFPALVQAAEIEAKAAGWSLLLADSLDDPELELENMLQLAARRVDAILVSPVHRTRSTEAVRRAAELRPVVQIDRLASTAVPHVGVDQRAGLTAVLDHLAASGRQCVAYVGAKTGEWPANERRQAFRAWVAAQGREDHSYLADSTSESGRHAIRRILRTFPQVDAVACCNDVIAVGVLLELHSLGVDVPGRIAVTGFDDTIMATVIQPALTSVVQPTDLIARAAFSWAQDGRRSREQLLFAPALVVRDSSALSPDAGLDARVSLATRSR